MEATQNELELREFLRRGGYWQIDVQAALALLERAGVRLHETQEYVFRQFWNSRSNVLVRAGRRWGKTFFGAALVLTHILTCPRPSVWVLAPERWQALKMLSYLKDFADRLGLDTRIDDSEDVRLYVEDVCVYGKVTVRPRGLVGEGLTLAIEDEAELSPERHYQLYVKPMLLDYDGRVVFLTSKYGNQWVRNVCEREGASIFEYPNWVNPHISTDRILRDFETTDDLAFRAMYANEDVETEYPVFPKLPIVKDMSTVRTHAVVIGLDWGFWSPFAAVMLHVMQDGTYYVSDCVYETGLTVTEQAGVVKRMAGPWFADATVVADPSCFVKHGDISIADQWSRHGLVALRGTRDLSGSLQLLIDLVGAEKLVVSPRAHALIDEMQKARAEPSKPSEIIGEDHAIDALRYALTYAIMLPRAPAVVPVGSLAWLELVAQHQRRLRELEEREW